MNMKTKKNFLQVSIFTDLFKHGGNVALSRMLQWIKDGAYEEKVRPMRQALAKGNKKEYDERKKKLPAFTLSSVYDGRRLDENIIDYNGLIMVDIDHLTPEATEDLFDKAVALPYAVAVFRSPSGCGLKIIVNPKIGYGEWGIVDGEEKKGNGEPNTPSLPTNHQPPYPLFPGL
ncbi:MAG: hypothetical protein MdMp024_0575 [Bacteroidales bacterium]